MTLHVRDTCLCLHAQRAARVLARRFDRALRPVGLTNGQFSLLMSLNRPGRVRMRDVADLLGMDRTTLTAALKPLNVGGLVATSSDPDDRRGRLLALTDSGRRRLAEAMPAWTMTQRAVEAELEDADRIRRDLTRLAGVK
ncbi:MarR family winged helix-turn-helix transcriptional regulator [Mesorhizobium sp. ZMM04-5]|uniref:MarR family winged helix-turn-helix transcriptional regulator n=1 Tax=Mesorhizobium marinum TaxID=3228790 RepID=A0ABV3QWG3_9HYPH